MKKNGERKFFNQNVLVVIILILQFFFITFIFAEKKQGYHSDELWNYGFANSSEGGSIYIRDKKTINAYKWVDSSLLLNYISVDESEIFDYKSVYDNAAKDLNPPLQYFLLHAISSIKTNTWSKWYCYIINIISFFLTQIFLYKTLKLVCNNRIGILGIILYGFCIGGINTTIYLRIYALGVAFAIMFFYYSIKTVYEKNKSKINKADLIKIFVIIVAGALTIHQFLIFAFAVVLLLSVYFLIKKEYKLMFVYGGVCLAGVLISIILFPSTMSHLFGYSSLRSVERMSTKYQFMTYASYLTRDITGVYISISPTFVQSVVSLVLGVFFAFFLIICLLFKNKKWYYGFMTKLKKYFVCVYNELRRTCLVLLLGICTVLFFIGVCSVNTNVIVMGVYSKRYIFLIYPVAVVIIMILIDSVSDGFDVLNKKKNTISFLIVVTLVLLSFWASDKAFYFNFEGDDSAFEKIEENADCIVVLKELWVMTCAVNELYDTDRFYLTDRENYVADNYDDIGKENPVYLLLDVSDERDLDEDNDIIESGDFFFNKKDYLKYYGELTISNKIEYVGADYLFDRKIEVYKLR